MMHLQQWWLVRYGDAYEQQWVFESEADARAFLTAVHGKMDPVPVTYARPTGSASQEARIDALEKQTEANRREICRNADVYQGLLDVFHAQQKKLAATVEALEGRVSRLEAAREAKPCDHPWFVRTVLSPLPNYIYLCGKCYSIVYGQ